LGITVIIFKSLIIFLQFVRPDQHPSVLCVEYIDTVMTSQKETEWMKTPLVGYYVRALSKCASLLGTDRASAMPALREAISLHWRLNPSRQPLTQLEMEQQIRLPLES
jgi:hypothetical protein